MYENTDEDHGRCSAIFVGAPPSTRQYEQLTDYSKTFKVRRVSLAVNRFFLAPLNTSQVLVVRIQRQSTLAIEFTRWRFVAEAATPDTFRSFVEHWVLNTVWFVLRFHAFWMGNFDIWYRHANHGGMVHLCRCANVSGIVLRSIKRVGCRCLEQHSVRIRYAFASVRILLYPSLQLSRTFFVAHARTFHGNRCRSELFTSTTPRPPPYLMSRRPRSASRLSNHLRFVQRPV